MIWIASSASLPHNDGTYILDLFLVCRLFASFKNDKKTIEVVAVVLVEFL